MNELIIRVSIAVLIILSYIISVVVFKHINGRYLQNILIPTGQNSGIKQGIPTLLYFWGPNCAQCSSQDLYLNAALFKLQKWENTFNIRKINAYEESDLASQYRIITVPTIVIVNSDGKIKSWNPGLMPSKKIINQLSIVSN
jgi:thioredoxin 1